MNAGTNANGSRARMALKAAHALLGVGAVVGASFLSGGTALGAPKSRLPVGTVAVYDHATQEWDGHIREQVAAWDAITPNLDFVVIEGQPATHCGMPESGIVICSGAYGGGYMGEAERRIDGAIVSGAIIRLDTAMHADYPQSEMPITVCHELGHVILNYSGHPEGADSCMGASATVGSFDANRAARMYGNAQPAADGTARNSGNAGDDGENADAGKGKEREVEVGPGPQPLTAEQIELARQEGAAYMAAKEAQAAYDQARGCSDVPNWDDDLPICGAS